MGEFELIRNLLLRPVRRAARVLPWVLATTAPLLDVPFGEQLAISTDTLVAGVHCRSLRPFPARSAFAWQWRPVIWRPWGNSCRIYPCPDPCRRLTPWLQPLMPSLNLMAQTCGLRLIGGDTTRGPLCLTLQFSGECPRPCPDPQRRAPR